MAEAKLFANCTFGELKSSEDDNKTSARMITISGQLPSSRGGSSHSCVVTTDNLNSVSYLRAKRNKESMKGEQSSFSQRTLHLLIVQQPNLLSKERKSDTEQSFHFEISG